MALYVDAGDRTGRLSFALGRLAMTRGVAAAVSVEEIYSALQRHASHDWGDVDKMDWLANDAALISDDERILSSYTSSEGTKFWIITEADRSATTVLLPGEY